MRNDKSSIKDNIFVAQECYGRNYAYSKDLPKDVPEMKDLYKKIHEKYIERKSYSCKNEVESHLKV
jgi:hypothetical protein